jgi:hypothetical protein
MTLMETMFQIAELTILQNGKVAVVGVSQGPVVKVGMRATAATAVGVLNIQVVSIGIVDPPPKNQNTKLLQLQVTGGDPRLLELTSIVLK